MARIRCSIAVAACLTLALTSGRDGLAGERFFQNLQSCTVVVLDAAKDMQPAQDPAEAWRGPTAAVVVTPTQILIGPKLDGSARLSGLPARLPNAIRQLGSVVLFLKPKEGGGFELADFMPSSEYAPLIQAWAKARESGEKAVAQLYCSAVLQDAEWLRSIPEDRRDALLRSATEALRELPPAALREAIPADLRDALRRKAEDLANAGATSSLCDLLDLFQILSDAPSAGLCRRLLAESREESVRKFAGRTYVLLAGKEALPAAEATFKTERSGPVREGLAEGVSRLAAADAPEVARTLAGFARIKLAGDRNAEVLALLVDGLARCRQDEAAAALVLIHDSSADRLLRRDAVNALRSMQTPAARQALAKMVRGGQ